MLVEKAFGEYTDFRIPGIVATENGTLIRYCECRRSRSDWADIDIKISRSEDVGGSWETSLIINSEKNTLNNPVMFVNGKTLVFLYCKNYKEIWKCVSRDDGVSFSEPERVDFEGGVDFLYSVVAVGPGHGIVHKGRLIVPVWFAYDKLDPKNHRPSFASTFYSDDNGESWNVGEIIFKNEMKNPSECALAVNALDEVIISMRHESTVKKRGLAKSEDGISGWRDFRFEEKLSDPVCMGSMTHKNGKIYHCNCDSEKERKHLTLKITEDSFESCDKIYVSEKGGYSDIAMLDGKICLFYEKTNSEGAFELYFEVIGQ